MEEDIADYEHQMLAPDFWDDNDKAQKVISQLNEAKASYQTIQDLVSQVDDLGMALELYEESQDLDMLSEAEDIMTVTSKALNNYELQLLLSGPHDSANAILEIHPGAGGTESQDWGSMLLRMYQRWADKQGFQVEVLDYQAGDEAGIKSVTLEIKGHNAYGYLKSEKGVHRLVRISPFDSNARRHTSFASIEVTPEMDDSIEIEINPDDIRVDTYRASGAGGQHINKTSSAVRITHIPTGIVTQSQAQRSQFQNRDQAMAMLKAKLYQREEEERAKEMAAIKGQQLEIGWGSQIRSYVFHPYSMVKDHRTGYEVGNSQAVIDGDLDGFMDAYLKWQVQNQD
ncbi:peptide chain release factor 2 [Eremococcus coleocola ACS-139-V-Col8]|uniref:Peptide chain release factor 2 n=1 Tax=Eremococcus coleocola ACS-139-V-Col8 TaxID=908337 RepID=E4KMX8_9LACT|nr:peptide chain release factor 2 [Eremococcus coleocola ACS-139-V-Col8]